ncbi:uncharacterized protein [Paralichthys olivaceus]|uniref:uncharacterized protein n=1 Tax=Paralichthys olivaceus TaxID=8255 RepID=UPI003752E243
MALTFLAYHNEGLRFNRDNLDRVLQQGDALYVGIKNQLILDKSFVSDHLTVEEMPKQVLTDTDIYNVQMSSVRCGCVKAPEHTPVGWLSLAKQLEALTTEVSHAILMVSPECFAVFRDRSGRYGLFDSHTRSGRGLPQPEGTAVMLTFNHLCDLIDHLHKLFKDRGCYAGYEFVPVSFHSVNSSGSHGQAADVEVTVSAASVPQPDTIAQDPESQSQTTSYLPEAETVGPNVDMSNVSSALPQAQLTVEAESPEKIECKAHPKDLGLNLGVEQTNKAGKNVSKLNRERQKKARRTSKSTPFEPTHISRSKCERIKYARCSEFRIKKLQAMRIKYTKDHHYHQQKLLSSKRNYRDPCVKGKKISYNARRYKTNPNFRCRQKKYMAQTYNTDSDVRETKKTYVKSKYACDHDYRQKQKQRQTRYYNDTVFRLYHIRRCTLNRRDKLATNATFHLHHKLKRALKIRRKYRRIVIHQTPQPVINSVMQAEMFSFREKIRNGPTYVCTVCHRALFANQVVRCNRSKFVKNVHLVASCLTGKYVHVCDTECSPTCTVPQERQQEWICHTCNSHLRRGSMPSIAVANELELAPIPPELGELNVLERQLIAKVLPFAKIIALPKGQQRAVHGAVVCVPSEVSATVNCLPRPSGEAQLLQVKLKRNIKYKGHQYFYTVNMRNVLAGLHTLKEMHSEYEDITIDESATFNSDDQPVEAEANGEQADQSKSDPEKDKEELRPGLALDTCMQPPDIAQDILSYGEGIFSIAPAQGNKPVGFFAIPKLEAMAFPVQFPTGQNTLDEVRQINVSPSMYFNARLFSADNRFAMDQTYLFFSQFVTETHIAKNSMSIQLRKGKPITRDGRKISSRMLQDNKEVERLITNKDATRFMQPLRGTPAYWEKALKDLHAMVRQVGKPTFFLTFSAAEMRWPEFIEVIKAQQGESVDFSQLDWNAKCDILRSNPVTVMRMFEKRVDALMNLILSDAQPIGQVEDYFYRVEFQARGSPHIHLVVWIKDAPEFGEDKDDEVCKFIDQHVTCQMPDPNADPELHKIVSEVQMHSRNHSKSCRKGSSECRFGYPKAPMDKTIITCPDDREDDDDKKPATSKSGRKGKKSKPKQRRLRQIQKDAMAKLKPIWTFLSESKNPPMTLSELLEKFQMTYQEFRVNVENLTTGYVIVMKRRPIDCWVNGFNDHLLRVWNANMDIQFVLDEYCCIAYMLSYMSKPEHEMTQTLNQVIGEVRKKDVNEKDEMKQIMQAYSKHREVSAQESVARTCSLPLKKCSRSVVFVQTDENALKMSLPMSKLKEMAPDTEQVWMSGLPEKYADRPEELETMSLAQFASEYRILYGRQTEGPNAIRLLNERGFIQKRTRGKPAIIRFPRFSEQKDPEKFHCRLLKLYLPHRSNDDLKSEQYPTYEQYYKCATKWEYAVKDLVDAMKNRYEGHGKKLQKALEKVSEEGSLFNAWNRFASEAEVDHLECLEQRPVSDPNEENERDDVPEYEVTRDGTVPAVEAPKLSAEYVRQLYRSLNETQASIFYAVREWCLKRVWGNNPDQFFYFVSGGAGCGKSHVIKCIYEEATKILHQLPRFRDQADMSMPAVLLTAFTGTAAFNISGKTLHSILKLPKSLKPPYRGLGNALDEMRATLSNADILIIDEISMVSKELFSYVHWRFQQIKGNKKPFGGMSVLAVGDFYQLPPLGRAKPLCVYEGSVLDLWKDNFKMVTLTQIMRQKDDLAFAELLNRMRVKPKTEALCDNDRALLNTRVTDINNCPPNALHIFATNKEVDAHNSATVSALHSDFVNIKAEDHLKDIPSGQMVQIGGVKGNKRDLPDNIQAAHGVRVMLIRNLDVEDGLVNGTFGTIANIVTREESGRTTVRLVGLKLDNPTAGQKLRKKVKGPSDDLVYIEKSEEYTSKKGVVRRQFPMKLAFACTAHKVQGMTMQSAVVCLKRVFESGMSYVALSRTTSLQGLYITDLDEKKIYADPQIAAAMENMEQASFQSTRPLLQNITAADQTAQTLTLVHHNAQGLPSHIEDMKCHHELRLADVLCITETHLSGSVDSPQFQLEGYNIFTRSRHVSYTNYPDMAKKDGGGVAVYCKSHIQAEARRYIQNVTDLEFVVVKLENPVQALIAAVYRPPHFSFERFLPNMSNLLDSLAIMNHQPVIVCGDFNEDLLSKGKKTIHELFHSRGYTQIITAATTQGQTLLDHIYVSQPHMCLQSGVLQTYYSYHSPVYCVLSL